ncbi:MAG: Pr6Pr family membrane protein [Gammaproteobacteria bacterium]|nr:Pr6Pr family membrane protein [Gammaproteobacteria bacterium]
MSPQARSLGVALALGAAFAVALQLGLSIRHQLEAGRTVGFAVLQYTGYYTIITNSFCALVAAACVWPARFGRFAASLRSPITITAAAVSIFMVGLLYVTLLTRVHHPQGLEHLSNLLLHYLIPPLFAQFWWRVVPKGSVDWRDVWRCMTLPTAYLIYLAVRGEATGLYPYYFIDVGQLGYVSAAINALAIAAVFLLATIGFIRLKR